MGATSMGRATGTGRTAASGIGGAGSGTSGSFGQLGHRLTHLVVPHSHDAADQVDAALITSQEGLRTLWGSSPCCC